MLTIDIFSFVFGGIFFPAIWHMVVIAWKVWKEGDAFDENDGDAHPDGNRLPSARH